MFGKLRVLYISLLTLMLAGCAVPAPTTLSNPNQYTRIGILPGYESETVRRVPPTFTKDAVVDHLKLDFGVNDMVMDRIKKVLEQTNYELVDLRSFSAAYAGTTKIHSSGEQTVIGASKPMFNDVVKSLVGDKGLDAYMVIDGGAVSIFQPQAKAPIVQMLDPPKGHHLTLQLNIYIVDGRTFQIAAAYHDALVETNYPDDWFAAPTEHVTETKNDLARMLDAKLEPALRQLGLINSARPGLSVHYIQTNPSPILAPAHAE